MDKPVTQLVHETEYSGETNVFLEAGWDLLTTYVTEYGEPYKRHETIHYVLAWQKEAEPKIPVGDPIKGYKDPMKEYLVSGFPPRC